MGTINKMELSKQKIELKKTRNGVISTTCIFNLWAKTSLTQVVLWSHISHSVDSEKLNYWTGNVIIERGTEVWIRDQITRSGEIKRSNTEIKCWDQGKTYSWLGEVKRMVGFSWQRNDHKLIMQDIFHWNWSNLISC